MMNTRISSYVFLFIGTFICLIRKGDCGCQFPDYIVNKNFTVAFLGQMSAKYIHLTEIKFSKDTYTGLRWGTGSCYKEAGRLNYVIKSRRYYHCLTAKKVSENVVVLIFRGLRLKKTPKPELLCNGGQLLVLREAGTSSVNADPIRDTLCFGSLECKFDDRFRCSSLIDYGKTTA